MSGDTVRGDRATPSSPVAVPVPAGAGPSAVAPIPGVEQPAGIEQAAPGSAAHAAPSPVPADDHRAADVIFDWPETDPAGGSMCKPGHYVGEYMCRLYIVQTSGSGAFDVSGSVDMQLEQTPDGELLRIANGHFSSDTLAAIPVAADIVGELHCATSKFEGTLENGTFSVALDLPVPFTQGTFSGPLSADYDKSSAQMANGQWNMMGELDLVPGSCMNGSWSAHWVAD